MTTEVRAITEEELGVEPEFELDEIGVEFEYPVRASDSDYPSLHAHQSHPLYNGNPGSWDLGLEDVPTGRMTRDHVGAEITSSVLDLHTTQPEVWYQATVNRAEELGFPFAANGWGETNFGLHMHLTNLSREKAEELWEVCQNNWMRVFLCASIGPNSADPWRHGGVSGDCIHGRRDWDYQRVMNSRGSRHYEWRLPEPVLPDHFAMIMHFLRLVEIEGVEFAAEYARERVETRDDRLTAIQQYRIADEEWSRWPENGAMDSGPRTDSSAAEYMVNLME